MFKDILIFTLLIFAAGCAISASAGAQSGRSSDMGNLTSVPDDIEDIVITDSSISDGNGLPNPGSSYNSKVIGPKSMTEIYLCLGVLAFGLFLVFFTGIIAMKKSTGWDSEVTRIFTVSVIVTAGLFLITAGYSDTQIAPMYGLLGTVVGYLLGKNPPGEPGSKPGP
jgi:hypothetical protein